MSSRLHRGKMCIACGSNTHLGMKSGTPQIWLLVDIFEILLLHVLPNDACKIAINLFPISRGPLENINFLFFLLQMQIWNGCNVLNIAGSPTKDINVNLSFLSSGSKVVEWTFSRIGKKFEFISEFRIKSCGMDLLQDWKKILNSFLSSGSKFVEWTPLGKVYKAFTLNQAIIWVPGFTEVKCVLPVALTPTWAWSQGPPRSDFWWIFLKFYFCMYCPMMHAKLP